MSPSADGRDRVDSVLQLPINTEMLKKNPQSPFCFPNAVTVYTSATSLYWLQGCSGSTNPLLIDVGQEAAVLLVEIIVQRVMPVLGLHQADNHKHRNDSSQDAWHDLTGTTGWCKTENVLLLKPAQVSFLIQSFTNHVTDFRALPRTPGQPVHTWGFEKHTGLGASLFGSCQELVGSIENCQEITWTIHSHSSLVWLTEHLRLLISLQWETELFTSLHRGLNVFNLRRGVLFSKITCDV